MPDSNQHNQIIGLSGSPFDAFRGGMSSDETMPASPLIYPSLDNPTERSLEIKQAQLEELRTKCNDATVRIADLTQSRDEALAWHRNAQLELEQSRKVQQICVHSVDTLKAQVQNARRTLRCLKQYLSELDGSIRDTLAQLGDVDITQLDITFDYGAPNGITVEQASDLAVDLLDSQAEVAGA